MLTVLEAARRAGREPETIRRWIRSGRLRARRIGRQLMIEERDLALLLEDAELPVPAAWRTMADGRPTPDVVRAIRLSQVGH